MKMKAAACAAALGFVLSACQESETTTTSFDELKAIAACDAQISGAKIDAEQFAEMEAKVAAQKLSAEECAEYAQMLEMIRETEANLDAALDSRDYSLGGSL